jgi:hypothetical protein|uniref:NET domain-containing protein n=1 Tax=viral metagenome TaxID=1070528 RepID=A0A6C0ILG3_9ZZZZ
MSTAMNTTTNDVYDVNINTYTPDELKELCQKLEEMSKINQVEAVRIFHKHNKDMINENKYGIHINVTDVENNVLKELEEFIEYVSNQEKKLTDMEELQQDIQTKYINKSY